MKQDFKLYFNFILVLQLIMSFILNCHQTFHIVFIRELKDTLAGDSIESESPPLLRSLLKKDENVFKGGPRLKGTQSSGNSHNISIVYILCSFIN